MVKIKKHYKLKIISILLVGVFLVNSVAYAADPLIDNFHLRVPSQINTKEGEERILEARERLLWKKVKPMLVTGTLVAGLVLFTLFAHNQYRYINHRLDRIERKIPLIKELNCQLITPHLDVSTVKPGAINLLLCKHASSKDFTELVPLLDKIFEKAKRENRKIIWYRESAPPIRMKNVKDIFPDLDIKRVFEDSEYKEEFRKKIKKRHERILVYHKTILENDIAVFPSIDFDLNSPIGFDFAVYSYMQWRSLNGYNLSVVPEQPSFTAYETGLKVALNREKKETVTKMRDDDFANLIVSKHSTDAYIITTIGTFHIELGSLLLAKDLSVNSYISDNALEAFTSIWRVFKPSIPSLKSIRSFM